MGETKNECKSPSCYDIFDYWKDKMITDDFQIVRFDPSDLSSCTGLPVVGSWDFPHCWACGEPRFLPAFSKEPTLKQIWNMKGLNLQKAHILGKQFYGSDSPENRFLLCPLCHAESPDTRDPENFFSWVLYYRKHYSFAQRYEYYLRQAAAMRGINFEHLCNVVSAIPPEEFEAFQHELLREAGLHGSFIAGSTKALTYISLLRRHGWL